MSGNDGEEIPEFVQQRLQRLRDALMELSENLVELKFEVDVVGRNEIEQVTKNFLKSLK